ncbi:MAG TPA: hypothetical protein VKM55_08785 [Candidatus Lokiarchaeia archaeon]|nr:hypothetical protein [Candidatus Lokiarchaeia archaeon]
MMLFTFPIEGPLRPFTLLLEWILALVCAQLSIVFVMKYRKQQDRPKYTQDLGCAFVFIGFSLLWYFYIASDYYADVNSRDMFVSFGTTSLSTCAFFFILFVEHHQKFFLTRYFFTVVYLAVLCLYFVLLVINLEAAREIEWLLVGIFAIFFVVFLNDLSKRMRNKREVRVTLSRTLSAFLTLTCGYIMTIDTVIDLAGLVARLVGSILQLGAFIAIAIQFLKLPPFSLLSWKQQIEALYIIDKAGICLFQKSYLSNSTNLDENLVSSAISSVNYILQEMTDTTTQGLSAIKKGDKAITIFSSELVNGAIISKEENYMISENLSHFIQTFEAIYRRILGKWNGDTTIFGPVEAMADKVFLP